MDSIKVPVHCFRCKTKADYDVNRADIQSTSNHRYYVSTICVTCGRKNTSLIKSNHSNKDDGHPEGDNNPSSS